MFGDLQERVHPVSGSSTRAHVSGERTGDASGEAQEERGRIGPGKGVRILLVDPRPLTASAIKDFLEAAPGPDASAQFDVVVAAPHRPPPSDMKFDLLLLHVSAHCDMAVEIRKSISAVAAPHRKLPVVIYSDCESAPTIAAAIRAGARGYLPSTLESREIVRALRLCASGLAVLPGNALAHLFDLQCAERVSETRAEEGRPTQFTAREYEVLQGLHDGMSNKAIARKLDLSESTVKVHVCSILRKLGVQNRTEAALAVDNGLTDRMGH